MSIIVKLQGLQSSDSPDKNIAFLKVNYNQKEYDWYYYIPSNTANVEKFISGSSSDIQIQIDNKELEWDSLDIESTTIIDQDTGQEIDVNVIKRDDTIFYVIIDSETGVETIVKTITRDEIVKSDIPDNYAIIKLSGLQSVNNDERALAHLKVNYNQTTYDWSIYIPVNIDTIDHFIFNAVDFIKSQIDEKELQWQQLEPKFNIITDPITNEQTTIEILKEDIVKPDIPDNYAKRRVLYPNIGDQLDAYWAGIGSQKYKDMIRKIQNIKNELPVVNALPKTEEELLEEKRANLFCSPLQAKIVLKQMGLLSSIEMLMASEDTDDILKLAWKHASVFERKSTFIELAKPLLNLNDIQLDELFEAASKIVLE